MMGSKTFESCLSSSSSSSRWTYDVFLSFRGEDTRKNFTDHLYSALVQDGIETYRDDDKLQRGEAIDTALMKAIENSRISIPVFSRNYASSRWCLQELAKIMECRETIGQTVLPIFLDGASPSDVRNQKGCFEDAFCSHEQKFNRETVERWRKALKEAADLAGWNSEDVADGHESRMIQLVVKMVSNILDNTPLDVAKYSVGIDSRVEELMRLLNVDSKCVRSIGICGMGGIGKTTIAKALYNRVFSSFEGFCFLADVAEEASQPKGLLCLQKQLLDNILKTEQAHINNVSQGKMVIKKRLRAKKILVILDNVDQQNQLDALADCNWFGSGSRIIITTRDEQILKVFRVNEIYWPKEMDENQSLQLFSKHAFGRDKPLKGYIELSKNVVITAGGLPLALEVLGSSLVGERLEVWESMVKKLRNFSPDKKVQETLKISYNSLLEYERYMFLDVACFFIGMDKELAIKIWEGCNFPSEIGLKVLVRKCLVKIGDNKELRMHDQLRDMGREIVHEESPKEPRMCSRLWIHDEVLDVLQKPMGTINVEGLLLNMENRRYGSCSKEVNLSTKAFASMPKLRLLRLDNAHFEGDLEHLPKNLSWLCWKGFPFKNIPSNFHLEKLVVLDLSQSKIAKIWHQNKLFEHLKVLNLSYCCYLVKTPDFSGLLCLERLILEGCTELVEVHETIGYLQELIFLNLRCCSKLNKLPKELGNLESLEELVVDHTAIEQLPDSIGDLENLTRLSLRGCRSLGNIPDSVWRIESLIYLTLGSIQIKEIPHCHVSLHKLEVLNIESCGVFNRLPDWIGNVRNLTSLCINGSVIAELPDIVGCLEKLEKLNISYCKKLVKLPGSMRKLRLLRHFNMEETGIVKLPNDFGFLSSLEELEMAFCREFEGFPESFGSLERLRTLHAQYNSKLSVLPTSFSGLCRLKELNVGGCNLSEIPSDFGKLSKLETLDLGCNKFSTLPTSISDLSSLKRLYLRSCFKLAFLPDLPSSLIEINAKDCTAMRSLPNLSNLANLQELRLNNCCKLITIHGLERLESLRGLYMSGWITIKNKLRARLLQRIFYHLSYFTLPGSEIPEWFSHHTLPCEVPRHSNGDITGVILCIVLMLTEEVPEEWYLFDASNNMIYIDIVVWRKGSIIFRSQTSMDGFTSSDQNQIYFCHFGEEHDDFVSILKGGDQIRISKIFIPKFKGLQMKKCGIHMVYKQNKGLESQDRQQPVYGNLADFFTSLVGFNYGGDDFEQGAVNVEGNLEHLPENLQGLRWKGFPFECIPTNFYLEKLLVLDLSHTKITKIWSAWHQNEEFKNLRVLNLSYCCYLIRTPDFSGLPHLERLILEECTELIEVHETIGDLEELVFLNLRRCSKLNNLPKNLGTLESLEEFLLDGTTIEILPYSIIDLMNHNLTRLCLHGCLLLREKPDSVWRMESLIPLNVAAIQIKETPSSHVSLKELEVLNIESSELFKGVPNWIGDWIGNLTSLWITDSITTELPDAVGSLEKLEKLNVSYCTGLVKLPRSMRKLKLLRYFNMEGTCIAKLPNDFGLLSSLEELEMAWCQEFEELPDAVGSFEKLEKLNVSNCKKLVKLPRSMGKLKLLRYFNMEGTHIAKLPNDFGLLSSLEELEMARCREFEELPDAVGSFEKLEKLNVSNCRKLVKLPRSMGKLKLLRYFNMEGTRIAKLPNDFGLLSSLKELEMARCREFEELPDVVGSLEKLEKLNVSNCCKLVKLPRSMGKLKLLRYFNMEGTLIAKLPNDFGLLSSLEELEMAECQEFEELPDAVGSLEKLEKLNVSNCCKLVKLPRSMGKLKLLRYFNMERTLKAKLPNDFWKLSKLETLKLGYNIFSTLPDSIGGLSQLRTLDLRRCRELEFLPKLPSSLIEIYAHTCTSMSSLPILSNLTNLQKLCLSGCCRLTMNCGFERLESLRYLTLPGSEIPEWFTHHTLSCEVPRHSNGQITGVILCFVLMRMIDFLPEDMIYIDIVVWRNNTEIFRSKTIMDCFNFSNQDQFYFWHFREKHDDLVSVLKVGDQIRVSKTFKQTFALSFSGSWINESLAVKKGGIHIVYRPNEGLESQDCQQSVYGKLADFFASRGRKWPTIMKQTKNLDHNSSREKENPLPESVMDHPLRRIR